MSNTLRWEIEERPGVTVFRLRGELNDFGGGFEPRSQLVAAVRRAREGELLVVDLTRITFITGDGCGVLLGPYRLARARQVNYCLASVPP